MKRMFLSAAVVLTLVSPIAFSHTAWLVPMVNTSIEKSGSGYQVYFGGHEGKLNEYPAEKVKTIAAINASGEALKVWRTMDDDATQIFVEGSPAIITLHFDNGVYSRLESGQSVNKAMNKVENALSGVSALKYHKTIVQWGGVATQAQGQPFEVVPINGDQPEAGKAFKLKVLINGKPAKGIPMGTGENTHESVTNDQGVAEFTPKAGNNRLWAGTRSDVTDSPEYTQLSIEYLLTFNAK